MLSEFLKDGGGGGGGGGGPCRRVLSIRHCNEEREFRERVK